jgi:pyruvate, orthophosphate dikinase
MTYVYSFDQVQKPDRKLLGGKGAGLCDMTKAGLPVPPGFIVTTEACLAYLGSKQLPADLMHQVGENLQSLEAKTGKSFRKGSNPLLVSVRSGAAVSMPGMMDTILDLGLNDETVKALEQISGDERFAYDSYRRFLQLFCKIALGVKGELFDQALEELKTRRGVKSDTDLNATDLKELVQTYREICRKETGHDFPSAPLEQLEHAVKAVFESWNSPRSIFYRKANSITPDQANGTAVTVQMMVFGNMGPDSATGVAFTRNPETGENKLYGEYLVNAQGEDVVAGVRTPKPVELLEEEMPKVHGELLTVRRQLEDYYHEIQDFEFTVEKGKLYLLQTRNGKMNPSAQVKTSLDLLREGMITEEQAILRVKPDNIEALLHRRFDPKAKPKALAKGVPASPGAASGIVVFDADTAAGIGKDGKKVILVREETKPEDVHGFYASEAILTSRGGRTSHAAVVARGLGKPCVVGCEAIRINLQGREFTVDGVHVKEGDPISVDGTTGEVLLGEIPTVEPEPTPEVIELLHLADRLRRLGVRANADTPDAAARARANGAEGIGLCRTERMFNAKDRLPIVQEMILAETPEERKRALDRLLPLQRKDFKEILKAMQSLPVTIRLLDPPLHEFLPSIEALQTQIEEAKKRGASAEEIHKIEKVVAKVRALWEVNPMLGHRGVRVGISHPEIYEMQARGIFEAYAELLKEGVEARPQIMIPQVALPEELAAVRKRVEQIAMEVEKETGVKMKYAYGTMMETVRACLLAGKVAEVADFMSFGTNDLTQATYSFSREDAEGKFLPGYIEAGILPANPFEILDRDGVGRLIRIVVDEGHAVKPEMEVGICGEHGGEPSSIEFCHKAGLTYVSCSAFRVTVARLAAARAVASERVKDKVTGLVTA